MTITYDPRTTHGYRAPWRVDAPWLSAPAWFGCLGRARAYLRAWAPESETPAQLPLWQEAA